jgi:hypothetical protein
VAATTVKRRVLLLATTTGYQTRAFADAADRLNVQLVFATDRCRQLDDPWGDSAIVVRFSDEEASIDAIVAANARERIDGILAVGDQPTVLAALAARALGLPGNPPEAAKRCRSKLLSRQTWRTAGLAVPWFTVASRDIDPTDLAVQIPYPAVVKPLALSGSRGVIRADGPQELVDAFRRVARLLRSPDVAATRDPNHLSVLVEGFIEGREFAVEGILSSGGLHVLALFDKPDPLDGPFFEETIYATPSVAEPEEQDQIARAVADAAAALGLCHGPIHAECRINRCGVFVLEVAARPIGGLCARALRFRDVSANAPTPTRQAPLGTPGSGLAHKEIPFEELLLRHALGEALDGFRREETAAGVMMMPIPAAGIYRGVDGVPEAAAVQGVDEVLITAKAGQTLVPLPEGASYLGFIIARRRSRDDVIAALRAAHARLRFIIDRAVAVVAIP